MTHRAPYPQEQEIGLARHKITPQRQNFMRDTHSISHEVCGTELMALLLECYEIKKLWPQPFHEEVNLLLSLAGEFIIDHRFCHYGTQDAGDFLIK